MASVHSELSTRNRMSRAVGDEDSFRAKPCLRTSLRISRTAAFVSRRR